MSPTKIAVPPLLLVLVVNGVAVCPGFSQAGEDAREPGAESTDMYSWVSEKLNEQERPVFKALVGESLLKVKQEKDSIFIVECQTKYGEKLSGLNGKGICYLDSNMAILAAYNIVKGESSLIAPLPSSIFLSNDEIKAIKERIIDGSYKGSDYFGAVMEPPIDEKKSSFSCLSGFSYNQKMPSQTPHEKNKIKPYKGWCIRKGGDVYEAWDNSAIPAQPPVTPEEKEPEQEK